ncbi:hypothetical protein BC827DRAFT_1263183 [Russula dissimulans]|nr:hypothetical protein BC827DRAFT_1263183 [Russula dissimulans]
MSYEDASQDASDNHPTVLSPNGSTLPWPRPRSPLPPYRLAKLANALGISAPIPPSDDSILSAASPSKPLSPDPRRSPAPSVASTPQLVSHSPVPSFQSKFLLHVVPPLHIPHESDSFESLQLTPPPSSASGYHTQFKRGTLVPLLPTLQSQLWAIAKEYALPSTAGMILYLVSSAQSPNPEATLTVPDEPGPRLSDDIWKHLWTQVAKFEAAETYSRSVTPNTATRLGLGDVGSFSPAQEYPSSSNTLRPFISTGRVTPQSFSPHTPTGSTVSSNPPTRSESSQSEFDSPDTSLPPDSRALMFDLPGLTSPSVIPILAKVEFDIDKRKATWYAPWIRSRKLNHQKREQRTRTQSDSGTSFVTENVSRSNSEADDPKSAPLPLRLVNRQATPRFLLSASEEGDNSYETDHPRLSESPLGLNDPDPDLGSIALPEPAKTDGDSANSNVEEELHVGPESQERPKLALDIPSSPTDTTARLSLPTVAVGAYKRAAPPPLTLMPHSFGASISVSGEPSPLATSSSGGLAYLRSGVSTPSEGAKRTGTVFDDLDLGLDLEDTGEFDEDDPNDRRRSQYVFKAKLDEIEKALVRLSPRDLQLDTRPSPTWSSWSSLGNGLSPGSAFSVSFPSGVSGHSPPGEGSNDVLDRPNAVMPTVPTSSPRQQHVKENSISGLDNLLVLPKLSLNGVPKPMPDSPYRESFFIPQGPESNETKARKRELNGHEIAYPAIDSPLLPKPKSSSSPVIPLSPDPFARFSSSHSPVSISQASTSFGVPPLQHVTKGETPPERRSSRSPHSREVSITTPVNAAEGERPPSSRFSLDSTDEGKANQSRVSLNAVKSIKSLWKKGRKASISFASGSAFASQTGSGPASPQPPPPVPVPSSSSASTSRPVTPAQSIASRESVTSLALPAERQPSKTLNHDAPSLSTSQLQQSHSTSSIHSMVFNQESPYPVHILPSHSKHRPRTASQASRIVPSPSTVDADVMPSPTPPPPTTTSASGTDKEKVAAAPKSILKSRRTDSAAGPLSPPPPPLPPPEQQLAMRSRRSRADSVARPSAPVSSSNGNGESRVTPPPSPFDSVRVSPTRERVRSSRAPALPRRPPDETITTMMEPMPLLRLGPDLRS